MSRRLLATAIVVWLLSAGSAWAGTTFILPFQGSVTHVFNAYECPNQSCPAASITTPWLGSARIEVDGSSDGIYAGAELLLFSFETGLISFTTRDLSVGTPITPIDPIVSVRNGNVSSVDGMVVLFSDVPIPVTFSGLTVAYFKEALPHFGQTTGIGTLGPVPEPATFALLMPGLVAIFAMHRRRSRCRRD